MHLGLLGGFFPSETPITIVYSCVPHPSCVFVFLALQPIVVVFYSPLAGFSLLVFEVSWSHTTNAPQSVGLLWTSDQSVAETPTWQHTTITTDKHPFPRWDSNPQSQQASGRRPTPKTARPLGPAPHPSYFPLFTKVLKPRPQLQTQ